MTTHFTRRADAVTEQLADLNLGVIVPPARDDLAAADFTTDELVGKIADGLAPAVDLDSLAVDLVSGKVTPSTAGKKLMGPTKAKLDAFVEKVREHALADADRPEWAPAALRASVVPIVKDRLAGAAQDMLDTVAGLPPVVKDRLAEVVDTSYGPTYGACLAADKFADALKWIAPTGDLATVHPASLAAVQQAVRAWGWYAAADPFPSLWWLCTGRVPQVTSSFTSTGYVGEAAGPGETFSTALLLVEGEAVDYVAAGVNLPFLVAAGYVDHFAPLTTPFGTGEDAEAYQARVERFTAYRQWVGEARETVNAGAAHLAGRDRMDELKRRAALPGLDAVEQFRAQL